MIRKTGVRARFASAGTLAAALLLTACGGADTQDKAGDGEQSKELKWASCMREAGVPVEDPKPGGPQAIPSGTDESKAEAATKKCQKFSPQGQVSDSQKKTWASELRGYSACMRKNGVANFPDPDENGTLVAPQDGSQDTQRYKDADAKCQDKLKSFQQQDLNQK
ncbi:hypothetical protein [Streptomyces sp. x-80]|jgi:hypothetical protein|uniref:hypothetical protein n=1 Tax=Streptomyces sp. x-80 TaxID=2789282 RepID=UPI003980FB8B